MVATPWGDSRSLRDRMLPPGPGTSADEVKTNQRDRLFGAMVACVGERGYEATRVADLVEVSGVSSRSFYDLFPNKEACFVATCEAILSRLVDALTETDDPAGAWEKRLQGSYAAIAAMLATQPAAAKLLLIDAHAAGRDAQAPLERAARELEQMTMARLAESAERAAIPAEMALAHAGALQGIARTRLRGGRPEGMAPLVPALTELMSGYRPPPTPLRLSIRPPSFGPESLEAHDDAERVLRAFAVVVAERGYAGTTIHEVAKRGSMSPATFYANFRDKGDALLAAIDSVGAQLVTAVMTAFHRTPEWAASVRAAIGSMLNFLASRPAMAHLLVVEAYAGGTRALDRRAQALSPLSALFAAGHRLAPEVHPVATEAIGGAIEALVHRRIREEGPGGLPSLAPICTYLALSPFLGAMGAATAANGPGRIRNPAVFERENLGDLLAVQPTKWSVLAVLGLRSADVEELAGDLGVPAEAIRGYVEELQTEGHIEEVEGEGAGALPKWRHRPILRVIEIEEWERLSPAERKEAAAEIVRLVNQDVSSSVESGAFTSRLDMHLTRVGFTVDEQGWRELAEIHRAAVLASQEVRLLSAQRMKGSGESGITGRSVQALFEVPED